MHILFFACNENVVREYVYSEQMLQKLLQKEAESFLVNREQFLLQKDIRIFFKWDGSAVTLLNAPENSYQLLREKKRMEQEHIERTSVLTLITIQRERLFLCLLFSEKIQYRLYLTGRRDISIGKNQGNTIYWGECLNTEQSVDGFGELQELWSGRQFCIRRNGSSAEVFADGRNGIYVNRERIGRYERRMLCFGDELWFLGVKFIWLEEMLAVCMEETGQEIFVAGLERHIPARAEEVTLLQTKPIFSPAPRNRLPLDKEPVELEAPPEKREFEKQPLFLTIGPAFTMALPMLLGFGVAIWAASARESSAGGGFGNGIFMYTGLITAVSSAILGSFWAFMNVRQRNRNLRASEQKRESAYRRYVSDSEHRIREKYRYNRNVLQSTYPVLSEYLSSEGNPLLLWNRLETDDDLLTYRLGMGKMDFDVPIIVPKERFSVVEDRLKDFPVLLKKRYRELKDVPICIDLFKERLHGIIGSSEMCISALIRILALQIGVTNSMEQVRMGFLFSTGKWQLQWLSVLRWLPHVWMDEAHLIAFDEQRAGEAAYQIEQQLRQQNCSIRHFIIFCDSYELLSEELRQDERISVLLFANDYGELVSECRSIILKTTDFSGWLMLGADCTFRKEILFDTISLSETDAYARRLCGIRLRTADTVSAIPAKVTIFELLGIQKVSSSSICESWQRNRTENSLSAEIGVTEGGRRCYLDAHEKGHGPHGLIAGMTGSGKSEMLQTIVLALSMKFSPQEAGFFLIDYKGGGMANLFSGLPHLLGSISNLSGSMIYRAMVSIRSENERRQRLFLKVSVNQIYDYQKLFRSGVVTEPLPHIFIIIDEFAELKREEPDFMRELISVAQVGRSLGIHLILATQKPAGTVDDNIFSNSRFRICLRVQDKQDSNDMLHRTDAAYISNPGRAFLQVGNDELFQPFQGAYTMEPYEAASCESEAVILLDEYGRRKSLYRPPKAERAEQVEVGTIGIERVGNGALQIDLLLKGMQQAAAYMGYTKVKPLWLPPLPTRLYYSQLFEKQWQKGEDTEERTEISVGGYDYPQKQKQGIFTLSLSKGGHHLICGMAASGKSTFLQTILYALLEKETPKTLHIYMIDYSSRLLLGFEESALLGGIITEDEQKELPKLFYLLEEFLHERKRLLKGGSFLQYQSRTGKAASDKLLQSETTADIAALPAVLLVIDNYGSFREKTGGSFDGIIQELSKQGENYGIYLLLTASGIGSSELPNRLFENCRTGICLSMNDRYQYCEVLRTSMMKLRLSENVKGRGMAWIDGEILEFQCALCLESGNDFDRMEKLKEKILQRNLTYAGERARQVPRIPDNPMLSEFVETLNLEKYRRCGREKNMLPVGYEERSGKIYALDLSNIRHVFLTGRKRTGKKNCLRVIKHAAELCQISCVEIKSAAQLGQCMKNEPVLSCVLYLIEELGAMINEFYVNQYQKETEQFLCEALGKMSLHKVVAIIEDTQLMQMSGRKLFEVLKQEAYGIHMGGALDSQSLFDFSDIPFSKQGITKRSGCGTVPKRSDSAFCGDVVIPLADFSSI